MTRVEPSLIILMYMASESVEEKVKRNCHVLYHRTQFFTQGKLSPSSHATILVSPVN